MSAPDNSDENLTLEKSKWIEEQVNRTLMFHFESSEILRKEAHATLGWLYAIIVGSTGYVVSHLSDGQLWIIIPLGLASFAGMVVSMHLLNGALLAKAVPSPGNVPSHIATAERLIKNEAQMRLSEAEGVETIIDDLVVLNSKTAQTINEARIAVAVIPAATLVVMLLVFLTSR
jgi:hypothetical protein